MRIRKLSFDSSASRAGGERVAINASGGAFLTFGGPVPPDLKISAESATGLSTAQDFDVVPGEAYLVDCASLVVTHAAVVGGAAFTLSVGYDGARVDGGGRFVQPYFRVGPRAVDVVPARIPNVIKDGIKVTINSGAATTLWTPALGKRIRLLRLLVELASQAATASSNYDLAISGSAASWTKTISYFTGAAASATLRSQGTPLDYGDGILLAVNEAIQIQCAAPPAGLSVILNVTLLGNEE